MMDKCIVLTDHEQADKQMVVLGDTDIREKIDEDDCEIFVRNSITNTIRLFKGSLNIFPCLRKKGMKKRKQ